MTCGIYFSLCVVLRLLFWLSPVRSFSLFHTIPIYIPRWLCVTTFVDQGWDIDRMTFGIYRFQPIVLLLPFWLSPVLSFSLFNTLLYIFRGESGYIAFYLLYCFSPFGCLPFCLSHCSTPSYIYSGVNLCNKVCRSGDRYWSDDIRGISVTTYCIAYPLLVFSQPLVLIVPHPALIPRLILCNKTFVDQACGVHWLLLIAETRFLSWSHAHTSSSLHAFDVRFLCCFANPLTASSSFSCFWRRIWSGNRLYNLWLYCRFQCEKEDLLPFGRVWKKINKCILCIIWGFCSLSLSANDHPFVAFPIHLPHGWGSFGTLPFVFFWSVKCVFANHRIEADSTLLKYSSGVVILRR